MDLAVDGDQRPVNSRGGGEDGAKDYSSQGPEPGPLCAPEGRAFFQTLVLCSVMADSVPPRGLHQARLPLQTLCDPFLSVLFAVPSDFLQSPALRELRCER